MYCTMCGKKLDDKMNFCIYCGETVPKENLNEKTDIEVPKENIRPSETPSKANINKKTKMKKKGKRRVLPIVIVIFIFLIVSTSILWFTDIINLDLINKTSYQTSSEKEVSVQPGDTYSVDDIGSIYFSENSLETEIEVSIKELGEDDEEGLASPIYEIILDNIPKESVELSLVLPDSYDDTKHIIGIEVGSYGISAATEKNDYIYIVPESIEDGHAIVTLKPEYFTMLEESLEDSSTRNRNVVYAAGKRKYHVKLGFFDTEFWYDDGHFRIVNEQWVGSISKKSVDALLTDLEFMYNEYKDKKFSYDKRTEWPFYVYITSLNDEGGYVLSSYALIEGKNPDLGWIELNNKYFGDGYSNGELKPLIAHEWFHFVQNNYTTADEVYWFDESTACYFESAYNSGSIPTITSEYWEKAYNSLFPETSAADEGYARYPFVQYLVNHYSEDVILNIYTKLKDGENLRNAITGSTGTTMSELVNAYYVELASGKIGSNNTYTLYSNILRSDDRYNQLGEGQKLTIPDFQSLSKDEKMGKIEVAKLNTSMKGESPHFICLDFDQELIDMMNDNTEMTLEASNSAMINLIRVKSKDVVVETSMGSMDPIVDMKKYLDDGWKYMVVLVNNETTEKSVELQIKMDFAPTLDEMVGQWADGTLTINDIYIDPAFEAAITAALEGMGDALEGCETTDGETVDTSSIKDIEGQSFKIAIDIAKISDTKGTLAYKQLVADGMEMDPAPFSYDKGLITANFEEEGTIVTITMDAYYSTKGDVGLMGTIFADYNKGLFTMDTKLEGTKPILVTVP